jgi:transcriptional regulator with XRE-family HTH domain
MTMREARKAKGLTVEQLSDRTGIGVSMLRMVERGERRLPLEQAVDMAEALGLRDDYRALRKIRGEIQADAICGLIPWYATGGPEVGR